MPRVGALILAVSGRGVESGRGGVAVRTAVLGRSVAVVGLVFDGDSSSVEVRTDLVAKCFAMISRYDFSGCSNQCMFVIEISWVRC